jgi:outer membrane lipoprotein SlyB
MARHVLPKVLSLALLAVLATVPDTAAARGGRCGNCGVVTNVDRIVYDNDKGAGGAVLGAIIGGLIGNQVGSGSGRKVATVAGAVGGGLIGRNQDLKRGGNGEPGLRLDIRMDKGGYRTLEIAGQPRIYRGDRVKVYNDRVELVGY